MIKQTQAHKPKMLPLPDRSIFGFWSFNINGPNRLDYLPDGQVTFQLTKFIYKENEYDWNQLFWLI